MFVRYAVYYTPPPGSALAEFGAELLGWDCATGMARPHLQLDDLDVAALTETPRRYGFHGTIKPPFRLALGYAESDLVAELAAIARSASPARLESLRLARMGRFLALVPTGDTDKLGALAARVVREIDPFRAPMEATELARRKSRRLTPTQEANLVRWGYPRVMQDFRFHMTLTGLLPPETAAKAESILAAMLGDWVGKPLVIDGFTLMGEDPEGRFHQIERFALAGRGQA